jgi:hypothetical protein
MPNRCLSMPIDVWPPQVIQDCYSPSLCTISSKRQLNCWATLFVLQIGCCIGWALVWISYWTVRGALLWLFLLVVCPTLFCNLCRSAGDCLKSEPKGGAAFTGLMVGRRLHMHPYFVSCLYFSDSVAVLAGHLCEFHTEQWVEHCSVPVSYLPHTFLQLTVCRQESSQLIVWRAEGRHCFCRIGGRKVPLHAPYFLLRLLLFFVPYSTTWPWRITFLCWRVQ